MNSGRGALKRAAFVCLFLVIFMTGCLHESNRAPVSNAGTAQHVMFGDSVRLDGSRSYDSDGSIFEYKWQLSHKPMGSQVSLDYSNQAMPQFVPDMPGIYVAELVVFDGEVYSGRDAVVITVDDGNIFGGLQPYPISPVHPQPVPPYIIPNPPFPPFPPFMPPPPPPQHSYIALIDQSMSISGFPPGVGHGSVQQSQWEIIAQPDGANVILSSFSGSEISFTADKVGDYNLEFRQLHGGQLLGFQKVLVHVQEKAISIESPFGMMGETMFPGQPIPLVLNMITDVQNALPTITWESSLIPGENGDFFPSGNSAMFIAQKEGEYTINVIVSTQDAEYTDSIVVDVAFHDPGPIVDPMFDHKGIIDACVNCHNGFRAHGFPISHIYSTNRCESCHGRDMWIPAISVDHNEVVGQCQDCHNGTVAIGKTANHINTTDRCENCHSTLAMVPVIRVDHAQVIGDCSSCHNNVIAIGLSPMHVPTTAPCSECHTTTGWIPVRDETTLTAFPPGLDLALDAGDGTFQVGESVSVTATLTNNGSTPIEYYRLSGTHVGVTIKLRGPTGDMFTLSHPDDPAADTANVTRAVLSPGESIVRNVIWDQTLPSGEVIMPGVYEVMATSVVTHVDGTSRGEFMQSSFIQIGLQSDLISEIDAILIGLREFNSWYVENGNSILCSTQQSGLIMINDYKVTPIQTFAPVPASQIHCSAGMTSALNLWQVSYKSTSPGQQPVYAVSINATTGEVLGSVVGDPAPVP